MGRSNAESATVFVDRVAAASARRAIHDNDTLRGLTETFKALGDSTRLKICLALARNELCVSDIAALLGVSESGISHQLRLLHTLRLVRMRRQGKLTYYTLDDEHIEDLIRLGVRHVNE
jgi:ArsR family transcriptional regulator, lead/cadmium/zinc/bismuth-responsive transcriptional repressor